MGANQKVSWVVRIQIHNNIRRYSTVNNQSFLIRQGWDSTERTLHIIGIKWAIFAAKDIAAGPIARVLLPFRVPSGFHCNFYSADNRFYTQAITN